MIDPFDGAELTESEMAELESYQRRQMREARSECATALQERRSAMHASGRDVMEYLGLPENEHLTARDLGFKSDSLEEGYARRRKSAEKAYRHVGYAQPVADELPADAADLVGLLRAAYTDVAADRKAKQAARLTGKTARRSVEKLHDAMCRYSDRQETVARTEYVPEPLRVSDLNYYAARAQTVYRELAARCPSCGPELAAAWRQGIDRMPAWVTETAALRGPSESVDFIYGDWVRAMTQRAQVITNWGTR